MTINSREQEIDLIISQAKKFALACQVNENGKWTIKSNNNWCLLELEDKWLLSVKNTAEIYLYNPEVLKFLERQWKRKFERRDEKLTLSSKVQNR